MKRLFLLMVFLAVSVNANAAKMSSYTENTTPNNDVYFIGVDPNDTSQTVNGSNYRYPLSSILGSGLFDLNVNSLTVSGTGDSWIELGNNTSFTDVLTGKGGYGLLNWLPYAILNGAPTRLALYSELGSAAPPTLQADDPTIANATGEYIATTSGDRFYVVHGVGVQTLAGTWTGDETDPVIGDITPSALTHDGTGVSLSATIASVTETNEEDREWSLYDVTDAAVEIDWSVFTGLSIATILIPADQNTYRVDVRCTDLAGNVGTASSANIEYAGGSSSLTTFIAGSENNGAALSTGTGTLTVTSMTHGVDHNSVTDGAFVSTAGYAQIQTSGNIDYAVGKISFWVYPTETQTNERNRYLFCDGTDYHTFSVSHSADDTLRFRTTDGSAYFTAATSTTLLTQNTWHFVELTWSDATDVVTLTIDSGTTATRSLSFTGPTEGTNFRLFSNDGNNAPYLGRFDTISIFSTTTEE